MAEWRLSPAECTGHSVWVPGSYAGPWPVRLVVPTHGKDDRYRESHRHVTQDSYEALVAQARKTPILCRGATVQVRYMELPLLEGGDGADESTAVTTTTAALRHSLSQSQTMVNNNTAPAAAAAANLVWPTHCLTEAEAATVCARETFEDQLLALLQGIAEAPFLTTLEARQTYGHAFTTVARLAFAAVFLPPECPGAWPEVSDARRSMLVGRRGGAGVDDNKKRKEVLTIIGDTTGEEVRDAWCARWLETEAHLIGDQMPVEPGPFDPLDALSEGQLPGAQVLATARRRARAAAARLLAHVLARRRAECGLRETPEAYTVAWGQALRAHLDTERRRAGWPGVALACARLASSSTALPPLAQPGTMQRKAAAMEAVMMAAAADMAGSSGEWRSPGAVSKDQLTDRNNPHTALSRRRERCARIHQSLATPAKLLDPALIRTAMPPCMRAVFLRERPTLKVKERLTVAGWLAAMGFPQETISDAELATVAFAGHEERAGLAKVQEMTACIHQARARAATATHWSCSGIISDTAHETDTLVQCPYVKLHGANYRDCQRACAAAEGRPSAIYDPLDHLLHQLKW